MIIYIKGNFALARIERKRKKKHTHTHTQIYNFHLRAMLLPQKTSQILPQLMWRVVSRREKIVGLYL